MSALLSVILAAVTPAMPVDANTWFTSKEHSKTALRVGERGPIPYTIDVAPDGTAIRCETPGKTDLDRKVCEIIMKSARFVPAKDDRGQPAFATYDGIASFLMPGKNTRPDRSKLAVTVDRLPEGVTGPAFAKVAFLVDGTGAISQCASTPGERRRFMQTVEALGPEACAHVAASYHPAPARDASGNAVPSVQTILVRFEIKATAPS